jgi:hypothetical protein
MIEFREEYTDEIPYSMGRSQLTQNQIWETEDNGGFKKVIMNATVTNLERFTKESVKSAIADYQKLIDSKQAIAVFNLGSNYEIPMSEMYGRVTKVNLRENNLLDVEIVLFDTPNGNIAYNLLKDTFGENIYLSAEGLSLSLPGGSKLTNLLNFKIM